MGVPRFRINEIINGKRGDHGRDSRSVEQGAWHLGEVLDQFADRSRPLRR